MTSSVAEWIAQNLRRADGGTHWRFEVDRSRAPVAWRWERYLEDRLAERSCDAHPSFLDCARDARSHGFRDGHAYSLRERDRARHSAWARPAPPAESAAVPPPTR